MNLYRIFLSFSLFIFTTLSVYSQNSDSVILKLFADQNLFQLNREYPSLKENASNEIRLFTEAYLYSFFNKPKIANQKIQELFSNHISWLGSENQLALVDLMADNFLKLEDYKQAASIYKQLIDQLKGNVDDSFLIVYEESHKIYSALENTLPIEVIYKKKIEKIPLKQDRVGLLTLPVSSSTGVSTLDFGF